MNTIQVAASRSYEVHIGNGLLTQLGAFSSQVVSGRTAAIVSDENVWGYYGETARSSLEQASFRVCSFVVSPGESSKSAGSFLNILNFLSENKLKRTDCVIALGGGVVGDLAGFAAACYLRGIPYVQVPTSLLAMIDASVGGKTAIDLPAGKNLCGAFYQPSLVLCDTGTLSTLPVENFREGCAEVIKYGILFDPALFAHLEKMGLAFDRATVISRCIDLKAQVVAQDEFDTGARRLLNLGHTFGHAIEAKSGYTISHGQAVAIGMAVVTKAAEKMQLCYKNTGNTILSLLKKFGLPTNTAFTAEELLPIALGDKKAEGSMVHMILPRAIGSCDIVPMAESQLLAFLKAGL